MERQDGTPRAIADALALIHEFIVKTTGQPATEGEIADALKKYFVLNEIKAHIEMARQEGL